MDERAARIVETAIALAEKDGYEAVRLREVAAMAKVALGTVYKRFASKEEILIAAVEREGEKLLARFQRVPEGDTAPERVETFFRDATRRLLERPKLARAFLRAVAVGDGMPGRLASLHAVVTGLVVSAIRGEPIGSVREWGTSADEEARIVAAALQQIWFASLIGWASGHQDVEGVVLQVRRAAERML
ncbi:MAG: TetR/AcrR family transcriptional regulator [Myxococcota bacterium]